MAELNLAGNHWLNVVYDENKSRWEAYQLDRVERGLERIEPKVGEFFAIAPRKGERFAPVLYEGMMYKHIKGEKGETVTKEIPYNAWVLVDTNYYFTMMVVQFDQIFWEHDYESEMGK